MVKHKIIREKGWSDKEYLYVYVKKSFFSPWEYQKLFHLDEIHKAREFIDGQFERPSILEIYKNGKLVNES